MRNTSILTLITVLLLTGNSAADKASPSCRVVLLPIEQALVRPHARISDKRLQDMLKVQFSRLTNVALLDHRHLAQLVDQTLIDDAVFELLVTDSLLETLARLDTLQSATAKSLEQQKVAHDQNIRYMVRASITPIRRQWHVSYSVTDTGTGAIVHARSFYEVDNRPALVANEIAKHMMRAMWKVLNKKNS